MNESVTETAARAGVSGPPQFKFLDHVSLPCRDLQEGIKFYRDVMGGEHVVEEGAFALFNIGGMRIGISSEGNTFMTPGAEYPHLAFNVGPDELVQMRAWLEACAIPMTNLWTRNGVLALMFFRDPSGNLIELFCEEGYEGAPDLPRGPVARGHGVAIDVDAIRYDEWKPPGE